MIKIKHKIALPFMIIMIVIPLVTMLIFNVIIQAYIYKIANEDLKDAIETTNFLLKQQEVNNFLEKGEQEGITATFPKFKTALRTSKIATNTEIIILGKQGRLVYPRTLSEDSFLNEDIIQAVKNLDIAKPKLAQKIKIDNKNYLVAKHSNKQLPYKLIYILSMDNADGLIRLVNLVLVSILAVATVLSLILSLIISKGISKPINIINAAAKKIGQGDFVIIEPINTSMEMYELSSSINSMSSNLERFEKSQRAFLQNASHELRTPLMSVQGYAEGIMKGIFSDNTQAAQIICNESKRLTALVEQLLVLSRIENNTYQINMCRIVLNNLMRDFIQRITGLAIKSDKQLVFEEDSSSITVQADEELLSQVIINIVSNSIRFAKSKVEVHLFKDDYKACINITDDGNGISEEDLPHIFDRFYKGKGGNFGLGLAIAKSSIDAMKGNITAGNSEKGAEFSITLPLLK